MDEYFHIDIQWLNTKERIFSARQLASVTDKPAHFGAGTIVARPLAAQRPVRLAKTGTGRQGALAALVAHGVAAISNLP